MEFLLSYFRVIGDDVAEHGNHEIDLDIRFGLRKKVLAQLNAEGKMRQVEVYVLVKQRLEQYIDADCSTHAEQVTRHKTSHPLAVQRKPGTEKEDNRRQDERPNGIRGHIHAYRLRP